MIRRRRGPGTAAIRSGKLLRRPTACTGALRCAVLCWGDRSQRELQEEAGRGQGQWRMEATKQDHLAPGPREFIEATGQPRCCCRCRRDHGLGLPHRFGRMMVKARGRSSFCPPVKDSHNRNGHRQQRIAAVAASFRETFRGTMCDGMNMCLISRCLLR